MIPWKLDPAEPSKLEMKGRDVVAMIFPVGVQAETLENTEIRTRYQLAPPPPSPTRCGRDSDREPSSQRLCSPVGSRAGGAGGAGRPVFSPKVAVMTFNYNSNDSSYCWRAAFVPITWFFST